MSIYLPGIELTHDHILGYCPPKPAIGGLADALQWLLGLPEDGEAPGRGTTRTTFVPADENQLPITSTSLV